ncbi:MAG: hypothetical protein CBC71_06190 [Rhodobacteraceae bacterium TMED111]|nr:hypothetical protein [Marinovum sp.]OUV41088.1 MAG: hypothetical protein CBC71_06190 [Rhodobacteraceae bacterium TMED111]|tara:strand:- start:402 stop:884 length:483 start_codon:yes stop_codon:yes gene_type:complete
MNNKLKELQDQINEFQKSLDELKSKPTTRRGRCKELKEGDVFCYMTYNDGSVFDCYFNSLTHKNFVENCLRTGNAFWTKEDAELWHKIDKRAYELEVQDRDKPDNTWYFYYCSISGFRVISDDGDKTQGTRYFTHDSANKLMEEFGDDLNFWITGEIENV